MLKQALLGLIVGLLATTIAGFAIQVDGYCYLEGQSNHAGTRVLFEADSPLAITDSTFTDGSGYFSIQLFPGIYDIYFSQGTYLGSAFFDQLTFESITLSEVVLLDASNAEYLSGSISGTLENSMYIVEGDLLVNELDSVSVNPGVRFYFLGDDESSYNFRIEGYLLAVGTETDSITFMPAPDSPGWSGLVFHGANDASRLEYCLITSSNARGINCNDCSPSFVHCDIIGNTDSRYPQSSGGGAGITLNSSHPTISYCNIIGNSSVSYDGGGIKCYYNSSPTLSYCTISNNTTPGVGGGIYIWGPCTIMLDHCSISGNSTEEYGGGAYIGQLVDISIINCTFSNNSAVEHGGAIHCENRSSLMMKNSIVYGNSGDGAVYIEDSFYSSFSISFNDFYDNMGSHLFGTAVPNYFEELVTVNGNDDSCDAYFNIFMDPLFVDPMGGDYHLQAGSPCIDAGDPNSPLDPDGTVVDIGAFYFNQLGIWGGGDDPMPSAFKLMPCYPNPFNPVTTLEFAVPMAARVNLVVYDVMGRNVATLVDGWRDVGSYKVVFDGSRLASGIYFARMQVEDFHQVQKMVLLK